MRPNAILARLHLSLVCKTGVKVTSIKICQLLFHYVLLLKRKYFFYHWRFKEHSFCIDLKRFILIMFFLVFSGEKIPLVPLKQQLQISRYLVPFENNVDILLALARYRECLQAVFFFLHFVQIISEMLFVIKAALYWFPNTYISVAFGLRD